MFIKSTVISPSFFSLYENKNFTTHTERINRTVKPLNVRLFCQNIQARIGSTSYVTLVNSALTLGDVGSLMRISSNSRKLISKEWFSFLSSFCLSKND